MLNQWHQYIAGLGHRSTTRPTSKKVSLPFPSTVTPKRSALRKSPGSPVSGWALRSQVPVPTKVKLPSGFSVT
jgi:hypothetical protein